MVRSTKSKFLSVTLSPETLQGPETPEKVTASPNPGLFEDRKNLNLERLKHQAVLKALDATAGNKTKAAELLGITREGLR